ncbi:MAG: hypothetical protein ACYC5O_02930 [Anaerolineae bacterium]
MQQPDLSARGWCDRVLKPARTIADLAAPRHRHHAPGRGDTVPATVGSTSANSPGI